MRRPLPLLMITLLSLAGCERAPTPAPTNVTTEDPAALAPVAVTVDIPTFTDVLEESGIAFRHHFLDSETGSNYRINPYDHGSGIYVADVDGDGLDDIYFLDFLGPNALYRNTGGMRFEDITERAGVAVDRALSVGAAFGDYDNDGDQDLFVTTYRGGNHLFRNRGDGTFEDVTSTAGLEYDGHSSAATWFDYDVDGDLDLYLNNIGKFTTETISHEADFFYSGVELPFPVLARAPNQRNPGEADVLYRNDGDGTFSDVTNAAGIDAGEWNGDAAVADIDLDGDPDLYVSNMFGTNHLFRNRGDGTFEEITDTALRWTSWGGMGARFFDGNGDAHPDLYVVDMHSDMWVDADKPEDLTHPEEKYNTPLGHTVGGGRVITSPEESAARAALFGNTYFENNGDGTFTERSREARLEMWWPWGIAVGDFNNDGREDLFVPSGMGYPFFYYPNHLFLNQPDGPFAEVARQAGIEPPALGETIDGAAIRGEAFTRSSRTAAVADFDRDGDVDIVVNNFNHEPYLLRNDTPAGSSLRILLRGRRANRDAIGARVRVVAGDRVIHRERTGAAGYLTQSSAVMHIGLGDATSVERVEILWPGRTTPHVVTDPPLGEVIEIVEPAE
ncbi:MAG: CRTAC1 family protein [Phycisphaerales bacterium]|nr:CRTAC1 family protein [Phycisphaerae bacterium]NNF44623.1 CRTAC1 family protein [Phycisphaerales bacterium]NNM26740.1 CRTAC1 family protein [Phycisphaerales bacterium]